MAILKFQIVVIFVLFSLNKNRYSSYIFYHKLLKLSFPMAWYGSEALFKHPFEIRGINRKTQILGRLYFKNQDQAHFALWNYILWDFFNIHPFAY